MAFLLETEVEDLVYGDFIESILLSLAKLRINDWKRHARKQNGLLFIKNDR